MIELRLRFAIFILYRRSIGYLLISMHVYVCNHSLFTTLILNWNGSLDTPLSVYVSTLSLLLLH